MQTLQQFCCLLYCHSVTTPYQQNLSCLPWWHHNLVTDCQRAWMKCHQGAQSPVFGSSILLKQKDVALQHRNQLLRPSYLGMGHWGRQVQGGTYTWLAPTNESKACLLVLGICVISCQPSTRCGITHSCPHAINHKGLWIEVSCMDSRAQGCVQCNKTAHCQPKMSNHHQSQ